MTQFVDVAVPLGVRKSFAYSVPPALAERIAVGQRVLAPFGRKMLTGVVVRISSEAPAGDFRIRARLSLEKLHDTAASLVINGNHFGFDAHQQGKPKFFVEGPEFGGLRFFDSALASGKPFEIEAARTGATLVFRIDGREALQMVGGGCSTRSGK